MDLERIRRYKRQSSRYRTAAMGEILEGRWVRAEELLWGSLVGAVKAVAYSRGFELKGEQDVKRYTASLAREFKGKGIGDAFDQLCSFSAAAYEYQDARFGRVQLRNLAGRVSSTVEILWKMLPQHEGDLLLG